MATVPTPQASVSRARTYASFVRLEHTLFSLPLLLAGVFSARGPALSAARWGLIAIAAVGARTSAMALNRIVDRRLDALNPRTAVRELPSGRMSMREAWVLLLVSAAAYLAACAALGRWYLLVAPVPLGVFATYPYLKRFTPFCHFGVGLALALAPLAGFAAAHPALESPGPALWLAAFAFVWVAGFDVIYATLDEEFDRANGVHSMVAWLGRARALRVSGLLHSIAGYLLIPVAVLIVGPLEGRPLWRVAPPFVLCVVAYALLKLEQRWAEDVNLAFFKVNVWVGVVVLAIVLAGRAVQGF